jgi:hypothetical protein
MKPTVLIQKFKSIFFKTTLEKIKQGSWWYYIQTTILWILEINSKES